MGMSRLKKYHNGKTDPLGGRHDSCPSHVVSYASAYSRASAATRPRMAGDLPRTRTLRAHAQFRQDLSMEWPYRWKPLERRCGNSCASTRWLPATSGNSPLRAMVIIGVHGLSVPHRGCTWRAGNGGRLPGSRSNWPDVAGSHLV